MRLISTFFILVFLSHPLLAAEVHLKDGSVLFGSILSLADGDDLILDTEYMDEVTIEWDAIEEIRDTAVIEIETYDGERYFGEITLTDGNMSIDGDDPVMVEPEEVFVIDEVSDGFWDGLDVYTDLGMNLVRGNNQVTQFSFGAGVRYDTRNHEISADMTSILNEQTDATDTRRGTFSATYSYKFRNRWLAQALFQFESDEQQGLDGRSLFGGGAGYRLINQRRHRVDLNAGLVVNSEKFDLTPREETLEGMVGGSYRLRSRVDWDVSLFVFPNLETSGRYRSQLDTSLSLDLIADLDFKVTAYNRYDSDPPLGNENHDSGITVGLSWSK